MLTLTTSANDLDTALACAFGVQHGGGVVALWFKLEEPELADVVIASARQAGIDLETLVTAYPTEESEGYLRARLEESGAVDLVVIVE